MKKISTKALLTKSLIYRILVILGEGSFAYVFTSGGTLFWSILPFVIAVNLIKIGGYFVYDLIWVGVLRTRWNIIGRIKRLFQPLEDEEEKLFVEEPPAGAD